MKLFRAQILDEETDLVLAQVFSYSEVGLEEEMGKLKWVKAAVRAIEQNVKELNQRN